MESGSDSLSLFDRLGRAVEDVPLVNVWWVVGSALILIAVIAVTALAWRRRHRWWLTLLIPLTLVSLVVTVGFAVNYHLGWVTTMGKLLGVPPYDPGSLDQITNPTGTWPRGQVIDTKIPGTASGVGTLRAMVYLPPQYYTDLDATFPVVYALHGTPGFTDPRGDDAGPNDIMSNTEVDNAAQLAAKEGHPVVVVAPMVSPMSLDTECVDGPMGKWATYLTQDVPAWVAQYPRLRTGAESTAIGGFSMGGTCAQVTALRNPQQYSVSGNLSGSPKASNDGGDAVLFGTGPQAAKPAEYDSTAILAANPASRSVKLWLGVGNADKEPGLVADMTQFANVARGYGMTVELVQYPGGHSFDVWRPAFRDWVPWAASYLYGDTPRSASSSPSSSPESSSSSSP